MQRKSESPVLLIVGTRPEGIKMAPVYQALKRAGIPTLLCSTSQHNTLLDEVFSTFDITPDIVLNIMRPGQDLFYVTQAVLQKTKEVLHQCKPCLVLVQGDTTTAMAAALAAFYARIPVAHVEAGLRTDDVFAPFPEELNRRIIGMIASYHFAPTASGVANLLATGVHRNKIFCTGNTVVDAISIIKEKIRTKALKISEHVRVFVSLCSEKNQKIGLLTVHRRESFGDNMERVLQVVKEYAQNDPSVCWIFPFHPNPIVIDTIAHVGLNELENVYLTDPLSYNELIYILDMATFVLTDSGGIQEEANSLGKPVAVLREKTERIEGILLGDAKLVGFDAHAIKESITWALHRATTQHKGASHTLYGDGHAAEKIVAFVQAHYDELQGKSDYTAKDAQRVAPTIVDKKDVPVKQVCVVGLGYIGLPTAIIAAEAGFQVVGFDVDSERVARINNGDPVIKEPETYEKLQFVLGTDYFKATDTFMPADTYVIAVPTPIKNDKTADLSFVYQAVDQIATHLKKDDLLIVESTIPVGSTRAIAQYLQEKTGLSYQNDFHVAYCPERVLPGNIFYELQSNDRVIGGLTKVAAEQAQFFYSQFIAGCCYITDDQTAEMVKLVENSSRDVQLAFAHQIASMAQSKGINPYTLIELANKHPRVKILQPTCGVGGHCIAVDPWFLVESFPNSSALIKAAREVNDAKPVEIIDKIRASVLEWRTKNDNKICNVLLCGISYKPNVDDLRESPAMQIAQELVGDTSMQAFVADPLIEPKKMAQLFDLRAVTNVEGMEKAHIIVFLVKHDRFKILDKKVLLNKTVLDFCGVLQSKSSFAKDQTFWAAESMMDFFITNQSTESSDLQ